MRRLVNPECDLPSDVLMPLTDIAVQQAKPKEKDYSVTDADGLSLNGTKSWHFRFSCHGKLLLNYYNQHELQTV